MKVFVSHKNVDATTAALAAQRLRLNGLHTYLDVLDGALHKDGSDLGDYLRARLSECDQLLAVVSPSTQGSWWVPWEIGVATEKDFLIATFASGAISLPDYLRKWPYLRSMADLDRYAEFSQHASRTLARKSAPGYRTSQELRSSVAHDFHKGLRRSLGQL